MQATTNNCYASFQVPVVGDAACAVPRTGANHSAGRQSGRRNSEGAAHCACMCVSLTSGMVNQPTPCQSLQVMMAGLMSLTELNSCATTV